MPITSDPRALKAPSSAGSSAVGQIFGLRASMATWGPVPATPKLGRLATHGRQAAQHLQYVGYCCMASGSHVGASVRGLL